MASILETIGDGLEQRLPDGVASVVGAGARVRDLGDGPGLGSEGPDRARDGWRRCTPGGDRDRPGRGLVVVLLRRDRDRQVAVLQGRLGGLGAGLPVRFDEPGDRAGCRDLGPDRLAVHVRRVHRRAGADRADDACCCGCSCRGGWRRRRASTPARPTPATSTTADEHAADVARADRVGRRVDRCRPELPQRLVDAVEGDRDRLPARRVHRPARQRLLQRAVRRARAGAG